MKVRIPASLKLAAKVLCVDEAELAESLLHTVTGAQAWQVAKALQKAGGK